MNNKVMTPKEAVELLDAYCATLNIDRQRHAELQTAANILRDFIKLKSAISEAKTSNKKEEK